MAKDRRVCKRKWITKVNQIFPERFFKCKKVLSCCCCYYCCYIRREITFLVRDEMRQQQYQHSNRCVSSTKLSLNDKFNKNGTVGELYSFAKVRIMEAVKRCGNEQTHDLNVTVTAEAIIFSDWLAWFWYVQKLQQHGLPSLSFHSSLLWLQHASPSLILIGWLDILIK